MTLKSKPGYRFGRRLGVMFVVAMLVTAIGGLLVITMGLLQLIFLGAGFIISRALNLPLDNPVVGIVASVGVLWMLFEASRGFDK